MKLVALTVVNGRKLKKSEVNLLAKLDSLGVMPATAPATRTNPYSGASHTLEPLAVTLYDFIINQHNAGNVGRLFPVSIWNRARYLFLDLWPNEYYNLID